MKLKLYKTNSGLGYREYAVLLNLLDGKFLCVDLNVYNRNDLFTGWNIGEVSKDNIRHMVPMSEDYRIEASEWYRQSPDVSQYFLDNYFNNRTKGMSKEDLVLCFSDEPEFQKELKKRLSDYERTNIDEHSYDFTFHIFEPFWIILDGEKSIFTMPISKMDKMIQDF